MTTRLTWGDAEPSDAADLNTFCCTPPKERSTTSPARKEYPRPPEARAQAIIRGLSIPRAAREGRRIWVGRDSHGVAAVASWKWIDEDIAMVGVVGLALRIRGQRRVYSTELVDTATAQVAGEAAERGLTEMNLVAYIHVDNRASRAFAGRFEMEAVSEPDKHGYALHSVTWAFAETAS